MFDALDMIEESQDRIKQRFEDYAVGKKNPQVQLNKIFKRKLQEIPLPTGDHYEFDTGVNDVDNDNLEDRIFKEYFKMAYKYSLEDVEERNRINAKSSNRKNSNSKLLENSKKSLSSQISNPKEISSQKSLGKSNESGDDIENEVEEETEVFKSSTYKSKTNPLLKSDENVQTELNQNSNRDSKSQVVDEEEDYEQQNSKYVDVEGLADKSDEEENEEEEIEEDQQPSINIVRSEMDKSKARSLTTSKRSRIKSSKVKEEGEDAEGSPDEDGDKAQKKKKKKNKDGKKKKKKPKGSDDEGGDEEGGDTEKKKKKSKRKKKTKSTVEQSDDEGKDGKIQPIENLDDDNYYVE